MEKSLNDHIQEWSRHYDQIQWVVTSILVAAVGGLLAFAFTTFNPSIALLGLGLTNLTLFFAASFRQLRHRLHAELTGPAKDLPPFRPGGRVRQWPIFVATLAVVDFVWLALLFEHGLLLTLTLGLALISLILLVPLYRMGNWRAPKPANTSTRASVKGSVKPVLPPDVPTAGRSPAAPEPVPPAASKPTARE